MTKAAVLYGFDEPLRVEAVKLKAPREDEVVVRLGASGVCHTDLSVLHGKLPFPPPVVLGHEGAGVVEEVGSRVTDVKPGDHVILSWVEGCGRCHYCIVGEGHLCDSGIRGAMEGKEFVFEKDGMDIARMASVGSFAERTIVRATGAIKIPDDVPFDVACLVGCGVMTGVGAAINTAHIHAGQSVAVFGCGGVGLNVIQGAALCGAGRIIAVDMLPQKLAWARDFGATDLVNAKDDPIEAIRGLTDGLGVDWAFEVIGVSSVIVQAFMALRRGGKVVVVGVPPVGEEVGIPAAVIALEEKSILGSLYGSANVRRDMPRLIELWRRGKLKLTELISRRIKLDDVNAAFAAIERGEVARTVIVF